MPYKLTAEEQILKMAILDVVDAGCNCESGEKHPFEFYEDEDLDNPDAFTEAMANEQRLRFCDAVIARARVLKTIDLDNSIRERR